MNDIAIIALCVAIASVLIVAGACLKIQQIKEYIDKTFEPSVKYDDVNGCGIRRVDYGEIQFVVDYPDGKNSYHLTYDAARSAAMSYGKHSLNT